MNLSWLKWLVIVLVIFGGGWLATTGGINYMYNKATSNPGVNATKDKENEEILTKYGGFLLATFRYEQAKKFYDSAIRLYPGGANRYWNRYQLARCHEKLDENRESAELLYSLWQDDANQTDHRVPNRDTLKLRIQKLLEVNQIDWDPFHER